MNNKDNQQQEWTLVNFSKVTNTMGVSSVSELHQRTCDAHNTALATERQHHEAILRALKGQRYALVELRPMVRSGHTHLVDKAIRLVDNALARTG